MRHFFREIDSRELELGLKSRARKTALGESEMEKCLKSLKNSVIDI